MDHSQEMASDQSGSAKEIPDPTHPLSDSQLLEGLQKGDEAAFETLIDRYHGSLLRLAKSFVRTHDVAEEVVQETWMGVLGGLEGFEGRSSLKTWIFTILTNKAKTRGIREDRSVPFSSLSNPANDPDEPAVDPERFLKTGPWTGHWATPPNPWDDETPERLLLSKESLENIEKAFESLPPNQKQVIILRDVEGMTSEEVCAMFEISDSNQRVLLHRARSKVRRTLEQYLEGNS